MYLSIFSLKFEKNYSEKLFCLFVYQLYYISCSRIFHSYEDREFEHNIYLVKNKKLIYIYINFNLVTFESYTLNPIHNVEDILIQQSMIHAGLMIQTMTALISLVIISFYFTGLRLKLFHEFHFVFFNNKSSIGHMLTYM